MKRHNWKVVLSLVSMIIILLSACGEPTMTRGQQIIAITPTSANTQASSTTHQSIVTGEVLGNLEIHGVEMAFKPSTLEVEKAGRYTITLINDGVLTHDITFPDGTKVTVDAGKQGSVDIMVPASGLKFICSIAGHEQAGMKGEIKVVGAQADAKPVATQAHTPTHGDEATATTTDVVADPAAPKYKLYDPTAPALLDGDVHESNWSCRRN